MSRLFPVCLLASALVVFVGCGGGADPDADAVAENSAPDAAPGNEAMMSPAAEGEMSGGAMDESMYGAGEAGAEAGAEMDPAMSTETDMVNYPGGANPGDAADPAMTEDMYAVPGEASGADAATDPAMTEEMYAAAAGAEAGAGDPGADAAISPEMEGAYPGGAVPGGEEGAGYAGGGVTEKVPEGFDGKAQLAFRQGRENDAMQYLYAHALTTDAGAESLLPTIRWVSGLREPKLAVRWGAGFIVTAPRNYTGDPKPVGSEQNIPTRGGNKAGGAEASSGYVGGGGESDYGAGGGGGGSKNSLLAKGAGELGEKLVAAYTKRVMNGDYGDVLKKALEGPGGGNRSNPGAGAAGYTTEMGEGAAGYEGATPGGGGDAAAADAMTQVTHIMPGLSMLGIGTQRELIERARGDGIDAVVIIDVKLRVNTSNGLVTNESTISLLDAETQKKHHMTKKFNNITIQLARADGKEDGVDEELEKLFEAIDANFKMTDLPAGLNADVAAKRVASLVAEKHDNPLPILAEARMYHAKGMLDESTLHTAYEQLLGVDSGRLLATGEEEDKKKVLSQWLPES